ncbi:hypothetical protein KBY55_04495 [Streptomyces sp. b94]|uniref:hypothetical protein n=1 Tax=Streptomyces sp. b94 TaxID=1827634 RepID=UPI001B37B9DF|nr:hypothetical protein [Streptomyces sp. b94]MBQ1095372.1 hypothetical protein [Streptomyces sp. b94]
MSQESYAPQREGELREAAERFTAAYAARADTYSGDVTSGSSRQIVMHTALSKALAGAFDGV